MLIVFQIETNPMFFSLFSPSHAACWLKNQLNNTTAQNICRSEICKLRNIYQLQINHHLLLLPSMVLLLPLATTTSVATDHASKTSCLTVWINDATSSINNYSHKNRHVVTLTCGWKLTHINPKDNVETWKWL